MHPPSLVCSEDGCDVTLPCLRSVVQRHAVCGSWCGPAMPCSFASAALPHCSHIAHLLHEWKCWVFYQVIFSALKPFFNLKCLIKKKKKSSSGKRKKERKHFRQPEITLQTLWKMLPILSPLLSEPIFCIKFSTVVNKHVFSGPAAIASHQMVLKKCSFLHHRSCLKSPWLRGAGCSLGCR